MAEQLSLIKPEHGALCVNCDLPCRLRDEFEAVGSRLRVTLCAEKQRRGIEPYRWEEGRGEHVDTPPSPRSVSSLYADCTVSVSTEKTLTPPEK